MGGVLGIFYTNNGTLDVFYTQIMDFCPQARMVSGISHQNGSVALAIWEPWSYGPRNPCCRPNHSCHTAYLFSGFGD